VIYHPQRLAQIYALAEQGQVALAHSQIEEATGLEPRNPAVWHLAGVIRRRAGDHVAAVEAFRTAIARGQSGAEVHNSLGLSLENLGETQAAAQAFAEAIARQASYWTAYPNYARVLCQLGQHATAERMLRDALVQQPRSAALHNALGATLIDAGRSDEAEAAYRTALGFSPGNRVAVIRLGYSLRQQGRAGEALALLAAHRAQLGGSPEFVEAVVGALVDDGQWRAAEAELEQLTAATPGYWPGHRALARLSREYGSDKDCYRSYRAMAERWPREPQVWLEWVSLMLSYRDYAPALEVITAAQAQIGPREHLAFAQAVALCEVGKGGEAEVLFRQLAPTASAASPIYLTARARNAIMLRDAALAEDMSNRALAQNPYNQFALAYLGIAWRLRDDPREFWLHDYERQARQIAIATLQDTSRLEELREVLRGLHTASQSPPDQTLRRGTQTEGALFNRAHPVIRDLRDAIADGVREYVAQLPTDPAHPFYARKAEAFRFTGSWSVRLTAAGFHIAHIHEQGWLSSALHLTVPPQVADDVADAGSLVLGEPPAELGLAFAPRRIVRPVEGSLVLFPSSMWHGTVPFSGASERLTVAFDAVPA
jgi:Flp pilus assembly protein TadD